MMLTVLIPFWHHHNPLHNIPSYLILFLTKYRSLFPEPDSHLLVKHVLCSLRPRSAAHPENETRQDGPARAVPVPDNQPGASQHDHRAPNHRGRAAPRSQIRESAVHNECVRSRPQIPRPKRAGYYRSCPTAGRQDRTGPHVSSLLRGMGGHQITGLVIS